MKKTHDHPPVDYEKVIETLTNENRQYLKLLDEIRIIISSESELEGLSLVGGTRSLMKNYKNLKDKVYLLEDKIKKLEK